MRIIVPLLILATQLCSNAIAQNHFQYPTDWAVVQKGAFVIPSEDLPWTDPEGRAGGKRIGYMRVGDIVRVGTCIHVNGPDDDSTGIYCNIHSETGVEGKTLKELLFPLEHKKTYAIARREVTLFDRLNPSKPREKFSRNASPIIEVKGDWKNALRDSTVDVIATYNLNRSGALTELAIQKSDLIESTYVIEMPEHPSHSPNKFERHRSATGEWELVGGPVCPWSIKPAINATAEQLAKKVFSDVGWDDDTVKDAQKLISKTFDMSATILDKVFCVSNIDAEVSAGFDFLGNKLKLSGKFPVYRKGKLFDFDVDVIEKDNVAQYWVLTSKTVTCDMGASVIDSRPRAVENVTVTVIKQSLPQYAPARLTVDGSKRRGLTIPEAVDIDNVPRLFIIEEFRHYIAARRYIADRIANSGLFDRMTRRERIILQHALISKLAYFARKAPEDDFGGIESNDTCKLVQVVKRGSGQAK